MYRIKPRPEEVDAVLSTLAEQEDMGGSRWPGMTYEQGLREGIRWLLGRVDNPLRDHPEYQPPE